MIRRLEMVPLSSLKAARRNPKLHSPGISASIERFGYVEPMVLDERTGRLVAGHGRREALERQRKNGAKPPAGVEVVDGEWSVPVLRGWSSRSDEEAEAYLVASNRLTELGGWSDTDLAAMLADLRKTHSLDGVGFSDEDVEALIEKVSREQRGSPPDEPAEVPDAKDCWVKEGETYALGKHRLACGDSAKVLGALCGDVRPVAMWTDPPYGVSVVGGARETPASRRGGKVVRNDGAGEFAAVVQAVFRAADSVLAPGASIYIAHPAGARALDFMRMTVEAGWTIKQTLVWVKDSFVLGRSDYHYKHEPIIYAAKPGAVGRHGRGGAWWHGDNKQTSVFEFPRPKASEDHPTMKPIGLVAAMLSNSCPVGGAVLEPFSGSGTTLMACDSLGMVCYACELDPRYAQSSIDRWQRHTGEKARRL
jgi:DNA modification methylase